MIGERVIITDKNNVFFNQEFVVVEPYSTLKTHWVLINGDETIYPRNDKFELVKNMVTRVIDGIPYSVTIQEAADIDAIVARNTKI